jgi:hypothetical protein
MSRLLLFAVTCISLLTTTQQSHAQVELKPTIGVTFTGVSEDPAGGEAKGQVGWHIGGTALFGDKLYGEAGLLYTVKSTEFTAADDVESLEFDGIKGFRIPAMVGYHLIGREKGLLNLRAFGGLAAFFVTSVDAEGLDTDDFESPTFGVFAGAGIDILIAFVDVKYEWSLTDVTAVDDFDLGKSRSFYASAGIRIPF